MSFGGFDYIDGCPLPTNELKYHSVLGGDKYRINVWINVCILYDSIILLLCYCLYCDQRPQMLMSKAMEYLSYVLYLYKHLYL